MPAPSHIVEFTDTENPTPHDLYPIAVPCAMDEISEAKAVEYALKVCADLHAGDHWPDPETLTLHARYER